jgi:hypothetical protein
MFNIYSGKLLKEVIVVEYTQFTVLITNLLSCTGQIEVVK